MLSENALRVHDIKPFISPLITLSTDYMTMINTALSFVTLMIS